MYTKYSAIILGLLVSSSTGWAQVSATPQRPKELVNRAALRGLRPVRVPAPATDAAVATSAAQSGGQARVAAANPASWGQMVGQTTYDLQTNRSTANRMALTGTALSAVWTQTCTFSGGMFANRGVGYNFTPDASIVLGQAGAPPTATFQNGLTGNCPSNFGISSVRTGWPEVAHVNGTELVVAHTGAGIVKMSRPLGAGVWSATTPLTFSQNIFGGANNGTWPRMMASGSTVHMIYTSNGSTTVPQAPSGVINPMVYNRSVDGGATWGQQNVLLPGMNAANFREIGGDRYTLGVNGTTVAIAAGDFGDHTLVWKSTSNGDAGSFQTYVIQPDFTDADTIIRPGQPVGDTAQVVASDGSMSVVVDNNGTVHWFSGSQLIQVIRDPATGRWVANGAYFPDVVRTMLYWNDRELRLSKPVAVAGLDTACSIFSSFTPCGLASPPAGGQTDQPYSVIGPVSMPTAITNANGDVYCIYAGGRIGTSNDATKDGQYFRDLYLLRLSFPGNNQIQTYVPKNISRDIEGITDGAAGVNGEESVFPSAVHTVVNNKIHYQWMSDFEPGTALMPANDADAEVENAIMYDNIDVSTLTWPTAAIITGVPCAAGTPLVAANQPACGGVLTLSASNVAAGATYRWTGPNNFVSTVAAPQISNVTSAATGLYQLIVTLGGCSASATRSVTVTVPAAAFSYAAGNQCAGGTGTLSGALAAGSVAGTFSATPAGLSLTAATGAVNLATSQPGTYTVTNTIAASGACPTTSATTSLVLAPRPTPTITASGPTTFCQGGSVTLTAAGGTSYLWTTGDTTASITVTTAGTYAVTAASGGCQATSTSVSTTVNPLPVAPTTTAAPASVSLGQSTTLTVTNPQAGVTYTWTGPGLPAAGRVGTSVMATPTATGTATYAVTAKTSSNCQATTTQSVTVTPTPVGLTITSFTPAFGAPGTVVTITGTNFTGATIVKFYTVAAASFTVVNATTITATVPATAVSGRLSVTTPLGTATSATAFGVGPTIGRFTPGQGAPGTVVLVQGRNFTGATAVQFNGLVAASFMVNSAAQIAAIVPAGATTGKVSVTTPAGTATSVADFTVLAGPAPTITSLSPASGVRGSTVVVTGTNFTGVTSVKLGVSTVATIAYTVDSPTQITLTVPSTAVTGKVFVTTSGGGMAQSPGVFTVILPPTISSFSPASGAVGTLVTITGKRLTGASAVRFGGVAASSYTVVSATRITATVPAGAVTGTLQVTNAAGTATSAGTFTVTGPRPAALAGGAGAPVEVDLYPNPASAWVEVQVTKLPPRTASLELLDGLGRVVRTVAVSEGYTRVSLANLLPGVYAVRVGATTKRLVVE